MISLLHFFVTQHLEQFLSSVESAISIPQHPTYLPLDLKALNLKYLGVLSYRH